MRSHALHYLWHGSRPHAASSQTTVIGRQMSVLVRFELRMQRTAMCRDATLDPLDADIRYVTRGVLAHGQHLDNCHTARTADTRMTTRPRRSVTLEDRFLARSEPIFINGVQALVRLMLLQAERDQAAGLITGGFVSGYRGSPLATLDSAFSQVADLVSARGIVVKPAVNEEMAATAIAGTQQIVQSPAARVQGVFALWYGKGPGLDRASDAVRHGNNQGSSPHGGVILAVGDDHVAKSSSIVCNSDDVAAGLKVPILYPADAAEITLSACMLCHVETHGILGRAEDPHRDRRRHPHRLQPLSCRRHWSFRPSRSRAWGCTTVGRRRRWSRKCARSTIVFRRYPLMFAPIDSTEP